MKDFLFIILFVLCLGFNNCSYTEKKDKILIVADEWPQMNSMAAGIFKTHEYIIDSVSQEKIPSGLSEYDCIFIYVHGVFIKKAELALIEYTNNGGKLIVLHHGIASAKIKNPEWLEFVGIRMERTNNEMTGWKVLQDTTFTMVNLSPGHFITSNKISYSKSVNFTTNYIDSISGEYEAFDLKNTEIFLNQKFTDIRKKKLLFGFSTENGLIMQPTAGWYERKSKGWLFYFQAGHQIVDFENENFIQLLRNTIEWHSEL